MSLYSLICTGVLFITTIILVISYYNQEMWYNERIHYRWQLSTTSTTIYGMVKVTPSKTTKTKTKNQYHNHWGTNMGDIDPLLNYCGCGYTFHVSTWQKLRMLLFGDLVITCPRCGTRMTYRMIHHEVKINTESIKNKGEVYKNG